MDEDRSAMLRTAGRPRRTVRSPSLYVSPPTMGRAQTLQDGGRASEAERVVREAINEDFSLYGLCFQLHGQRRRGRFGRLHLAARWFAILAALADRSLSSERRQSCLKLQRELAFVVRKEDPAAEAAHRARWKQIHKTQRAKYKQRRDIEDR